MTQPVSTSNPIDRLPSELKNATRVFVLALKKTWAKSPSYYISVWVENTSNKRPPKLYTYLYWLFWRKSPDGKNEFVSGEKLEHSIFYSFAQLADLIINIASRKILSNGYEIYYFKAKTDQGEGLIKQVRPELEKLKPKEEKVDYLPKIFESDNFWAAARVRAKNAKW